MFFNLRDKNFLFSQALRARIALFVGFVAQGFFCGHAANYSGEPEPSHSHISATLEAKAGYFFFTDSKMRAIYDKGGWDVQLSGSCPVWKWLEVYGSVEYLEKHGKSLGGHQNTSIWEIPISVGLRPVIGISKNVQYYFTLGPRYFFVYQHNSSSYVSHNVNNNGLGLFVNTGFNFILCSHLLVDLFGEYSYKQMRFYAQKSDEYGKTVDVGGFSFGGGLGYAF